MTAANGGGGGARARGHSRHGSVDAGRATCSVCLDSFVLDELTAMHGHRDICAECLTLHLRSRTGAHAVGAFSQCYRPGCVAELTVDDVERNVPPLAPNVAADIAERVRACKRASVEAADGAEPCPITDEELQQISVNMRLCPGCRVPVERTYGCYHVAHQCTATTRTDFCITCGTILDRTAHQLEFLSRARHFPAGFYSPCVVALAALRRRARQFSSLAVDTDQAASGCAPPHLPSPTSAAPHGATLVDDHGGSGHLQPTLVLEAAQLARISNVYSRKLHEIRESFEALFWVVLVVAIVCGQTRTLFYVTLYIVYLQLAVVGALFAAFALAAWAGAWLVYAVLAHVLMPLFGMGALVGSVVLVVAVGAFSVPPDGAERVQAGALLYGGMAVRAGLSIVMSLRLFNLNVRGWANRAVLPFFIAWQLRAVYNLSNLRAQILLQRSNAVMRKHERSRFVALCAFQELLELCESFVHSPTEHGVPWHAHYALVSILLYHLGQYVAPLVRSALGAAAAAAAAAPVTPAV